jgi:RNA polymerase sigma factor (sigma-70 family)
MSEAPESFERLLALAKQGDDDALARLVRQYESDIRLVARLRLGAALRPYLDTGDLVQSVHKSLLAGLVQNKFDFDSPDQLVALTLVRRKAAQHWRRLKRRERLSGAGDDPADLPGQLLSLSSAEPDPARATQFRDAVEHVCRQHAPLERRVLELHLQGYRTAEVARELGLNADVLRVRVSRLRQRLRAAGVLAEWL